jgi:hypothetical protein
MEQVQQCFTCRWGWAFNEEYEGDVSDLTGYCHRHAPKPSMWNQQLLELGIVWPPVEGDDGCGEWTTRFI